jgi:hypothetical protein
MATAMYSHLSDVLQTKTLCWRLAFPIGLLSSTCCSKGTTIQNEILWGHQLSHEHEPNDLKWWPSCVQQFNWKRYL